MGRRQHRIGALAALLGFTIALSGCAWRPKLRAIDGIAADDFRDLLTGGGGTRSQPPPGTTAGIRVTYLGTSGFLVERGADAVLLAPFFSHHWFLRLGFWRLDTDESLIEDQLGRLRQPLAGVWSVLVGHGHYDHLLDIPHIADTYCPAATIFGSRSVVNTLKSKPGLRVGPPLNGMAEREPGDTGDWVYNVTSTMRFMAIASDHAPNFAGITVATGSTDAPLARFPRKAGGLKEGETLAYMIDFLDPNKADPVDFRVYFQDAAESPQPYHSLRLNTRAPARRIDLAIVCVAAYEEVEDNDYPESLNSVLQPRQFLLAHWENFFLPWSRDVADLRAVPHTNPRSFTTRLETARPQGATWVMPTPNTTLAY